MTHSDTMLSPRLERLLNHGRQHLISGGLKGIEKESLRIGRDGIISQKPHPKSLGSALTHPYITTDYSEALIELITPPLAEIEDTIDYLTDLHQFVYDHLDDEMLLGASMPCGIDGDESIPIANYGTSNIGKMKHVYRRGLWHRYGRTMQSIAGIHFNYSVPPELWSVLREIENNQSSLEAFTADGYFGLIRNFQRVGWIILYLFGASPAICKNFFKSRPSLMDQFEVLNKGTLYHPYATSLRMSDIGYKSNNQASLNIDYNSLPGYIESLYHAITTPYPEYEKIGVKVNGEYQQLNCNILQIENEFYSTVRPKQIAMSGEKPTLALKRRGLRYIEMRSLDIDVFKPAGIDASRGRFIEALLLNCLLHDSLPHTLEDYRIFNANQLAVANNGRKPGLELNKNGKTIGLQDWANEILDAMEPICAVLDEGLNDKPYSAALTEQREVVRNPDLTPSARMLSAMSRDDQSFSCFEQQTSLNHAQYFKSQKLSDARKREFLQLAEQSMIKQAEIESRDTLSFDDFLANYFAQCDDITTTT
ncbi:MAG: glutamate--cysteine ligase [Methylomicrobium sp.]